MIDFEDFLNTASRDSNGNIDFVKSKEEYTKALIKWNDENSLEKISQSDKLRETISNNPIASKVSQVGERSVKDAAIQAVACLKENYANLQITHRIEPIAYCRCGCNEPLSTVSKISKHSDGHCRAGCGRKTQLSANGNKYKLFCSPICKIKGEYLEPTSLSQLEINKRLAVNFSNNELEIVRYGGAGISPDGGIVFLTLPKSKTMLIVGVIEHKYQGTNEKRIAEGKDKQAYGNAFERAYKNYHVIANFMRGEDITPYHIYVHGCDFENSNSTIPDRATSMTNNFPFNLDLSKNSKDIYGEVARRGSVFELWKLTKAQLTDNIYSMYEKSIQYYLNKYAEEFNDSPA